MAASPHFQNEMDDEGPSPGPEFWRNRTQVLIDMILRHTSPDDYRRDPSIYTGSAGIAWALLCASEALTEDAPRLLDLANRYIGAAQAARNSRKHVSSLLCGDAGTLLVAALLAQRQGDHGTAARYTRDYASMHTVAVDGGVPDEILYGRAGYLAGALILRREIGPEAMPLSTVHTVVQALLQSGRNGAARFASTHRQPKPSPLMFEWHGKEYVGGAHGYMGILWVLLQCRSLWVGEPGVADEVTGTLNYMAELETGPEGEPNGDFPSSVPKGKTLVHWCHGATGAALALAQASVTLASQECAHMALRAGEVVWQRGLLKKGPGLCHGIGGNGLVLLALYRATGDQLWLRRAEAFGRFVHSEASRPESRTPDHPLSLFEGLSGAAVFCASLANPRGDIFPLFDVVVPPLSASFVTDEEADPQNNKE